MTVNLLSQTILSIRGNSLANNSTPVISANRIASDLPSIINRRAELLHQNERAADAQTAAKISNSLFLSHTIPVANSEGNYIVDGVLFSKNELAQCRSIMQSAAAGIETSGTVDYINYAQISIANRAIQTFASENLNKEQATVLTGAMQNYVEDILATEKTLLSGAGYITSYSGECSAYYGTQKSYTDTEIKVINDLIDEMNRVSGSNKAHVESSFTSTIASATNKSVINSISDLFSTTDLSNSAAIDQVMTQYRSIMTPVYLASGISNEHGSLTRVLDNNVARLSDFISRVMLSSKCSTLSMRI
ncbi:MAG: hypothetical protein IKC24_01340 [Oscillospiraceae bacterium]|nr:hypothetical protein [Oscillospiraceae bacterium]